MGGMDDLYRDYILEHYRRPHNFGVLESTTASFEGANPLCGDRITLTPANNYADNNYIHHVGVVGRSGCGIELTGAQLAGHGVQLPDRKSVV